MKRILFFLLVLAATCPARLSAQEQSFTGVAALNPGGGLLHIIPFAPVVFCGAPATGGTPCTNLATTYNSSTGSQACSPGQGTIPTTNTCSAVADVNGNFGAYAAAGNYTYYFQANGVWHGPYNAPMSSTGGTPGGLTCQVQYNNGGTFAGLPMCWNSVTSTLALTGTLNISGPLSVGAAPSGVFAPNSSGLACNETSAAGTPTAGVDYIRCDSVTHQLVCSVNGGAEYPCNGLPALGVAQIGDAMRYGVNGDGQWDAVNATYKNTTVSVDTDTLLTGGTMTQTATGLGSTSLNNPNATDGYSFTYSASASASTSTVLGVAQGTGGNASTYGWQAFYRWTGRWSAGSTTGERCWLGLGNYSITGTTQEAYAMLGTVKYATNNPQVSTLAFRYDEGTDTTWQAVAQIGGGSQTIVSTIVAIDTNPHFFDITSAGGTANFFIDHALVATISTNVPTTTSGTGLGEGLFTQFWACDNEDVATAISAKFYWMGISTK